MVKDLFPERETVESPAEIAERIRRHYRIGPRAIIEATIEQKSPPAGCVDIDGKRWSWRIGLSGLQLRHALGGAAIAGPESFHQHNSMSASEIEKRNRQVMAFLLGGAILCAALAVISQHLGMVAVPIGYFILACIAVSTAIIRASSRLPEAGTDPSSIRVGGGRA